MNFELVLLLCFLVEGTPSSRSGFYVDNGEDQTVADAALDEGEKRALGERLREFLGLPGGGNKGEAERARKAASRFLMEVYKAVLDEENVSYNRKRKRDVEFSREEQDAIDISDLIMSFESVEHQISEVRHEKGKRLMFNISELPLSDDIVGAELRIYQDQSVSKKKQNRQYTISAFQVIRNDGGEQELEYISSTNTTAQYTGWISLNMTKSATTWAAFPDSNKGLYLSVHPADRPGHEVKPGDVGLVTKGGDMAPFVVVFMKNSKGVRQRDVRDLHLRRIKKSKYSTVMKSSYSQAGFYYGQDGPGCRVHTLYVDFTELNWDGWIIAPAGFAAYFCSGRCDFPLNAHVNATNHAIVQSLMHLLKPWEFPKPCCAPTKLHPLPVLYFGDDNSVIMKKYKNMIVKSCGCH